jgi:5-methylcytosine-specific restriction protein A
MLLVLLPIYDGKTSSPELNGFPEGGRVTLEVNRYERDHRNRTLCLQARGYRCTVCDFNFAERYGELGRDYIHVHHLTPVSQMGNGYVINPLVDLVPICPNCHAMIHKANPPLTPESLKILLVRQLLAIMPES